MNKGLGNIFRGISLLIIGTLLAGGGWYGWNHYQETRSTAQPAVLGTEKPVEACTPALLESKPPTITLTTDRKWYLKGAEIKTATQNIQLTVDVTNIPTECEQKSLQFSYTLAKLAGDLNKVNNEQRYVATIPYKSVSIGEQTIAVMGKITITDNESIALTQSVTTVSISYPVYVTWTLDWEGFAVNQKYLDTIDGIAKKHTMPLTHFFNPRYFVSSSFNKQTAQHYTKWVMNRQDDYKDSIGLHLHMFTDLVAAAGVTPEVSPNWGGRKDGYDVPFSRYSAEDQLKLLTFGRDTLVRNGLPKPTLFRAGGWYANEDTMNALVSLGFQADASGRTAYSFGTNKLQGNWTLSTKQQPYWLCRTDQNKTCTGANRLKLLEIPNNGADSYAYSAQVMIDRFKENYPRKPVGKHVVVTYLSHPEWFSTDEPKIKELFAYIDKYAYNEDKGPVQYVTLHTVINTWKANKY